MSVAAIALAAFVAQCTPIRWFSPEPKSLNLLNGSSAYCLVVDQSNWNAALAQEGHRRGFKMLALLPSNQPLASSDGTIVASHDASPVNGSASVFFSTRDHLRPAGGLIALEQGVWAGIRILEDEITTPSSAPWIDTNLGYLRYLSSQTKDVVWLFNRPPAGHAYSMRRYQQMLSDAMIGGAHWVIDLDDSTRKKLLSGDGATLKDWQSLLRLAEFQCKISEITGRRIYSRLGVSVSPETGAYVSGGVLDMIDAQQIPFQVVQSGEGMQQFFNFANNEEVKFPKTSLGKILVLPKDVDALEPLYRKVEVIVGRTNFGLRVFNAAGLLSSPVELPGGKGLNVEIVNYTDLAADTITLHVFGDWKTAVLQSPGQPERKLTTYPVKGATAVEIESLDIFGVVRIY